MRSLCRLAVAAAVLAPATLSLPARGEATQKPGGEPQKLSRDWKRIGGSDLDVVGTADAGELRRARDQIESFRSVLAAVLPGVRLSSSEATTLFLFRDYRTFERFVPRDRAGHTTVGVGGFFETRPMATSL